MKIEYIEGNIKFLSAINKNLKFTNQIINITFEKDDISDIVLDYLGRNGYLDDIFNTKIKFKFKKICIYKNYHKSTKDGIIKQKGTKISISESKLSEILLKFISDHKESYIRNDINISSGTMRYITVDKYNKIVKLYIHLSLK